MTKSEIRLRSSQQNVVDSDLQAWLMVKEKTLPWLDVRGLWLKGFSLSRNEFVIGPQQFEACNGRKAG